MDEVRVIRVLIDLDGSAFEPPSPDSGDGPVTPSGDDDKSKDKSEKRFQRYIKSQIIGYAKKTLDVAEQMIGSYYNLQENYKANTGMQNAKKAIGATMSIAQATMAGYSAGNWVGAVVGAAVSTLSIAIEVGKNYMSESERLAELAYGKRYKAEALGLIDGSRGTEN